MPLNKEITKTIQVRRTRHAGHCWRSRDELISDVLLWTPTYGREKAGRPDRTYIQQLCEHTECSPEDLPEAMNDREKWRERVKDIRASGMTWGWYIYIYIYIYIYTEGVRGVMVIVLENGNYNTSSNPDKTVCISHRPNILYSHTRYG